MPATVPRQCQACATAIAAGTEWCLVKPNRNYYYCTGCAHTQLLQCCFCGALDTRGAGMDWLRIQVPPGWRPPLTGRMLDRPPVFCPACHPTQAAGCPQCGHYVPRSCTEEHDGQLYCWQCVNLRCAACARPVGSRPYRSNAFSLPGVQTCRRCYSQGRTSTSFIVNASQRKVGLELETLAPPVLKDGGKEFLKFGIFKGDGSLRPTPGQATLGGWELNMFPANGDLLLENVQQVCNLLQRRGFHVNGSCGMHVHLDMQHDSVAYQQKVVQTWQAFQPLLFSMMQASRRNNTYVYPEVGASHYCCLNTSMAHGTYEVRMHHGTLDPDEINGWLLLLLQLWDHARDATELPLAGSSQRTLVNALFSSFKLPLRLRKEVVSRLHKHLSPAEQQVILAKSKKPTSSPPPRTYAYTRVPSDNNLDIGALQDWMRSTNPRRS